MIESMMIQVLLALPLLLGAYFSFSLMKLPDLSIESAYLFGATAAVSLRGWVPEEALFLVAIGGGACVGGVVTLLNQVYRLPFLLAAIITNGLFHGLTQWVLGTSVVSITGEESIVTFITVVVLLTCVVALVLRSQLGYAFAIYGNNPNFCRHHGISTKFVVMSGVMLADGCAGLSGYLFVQSNGFIDLTMGYGVVLLSITALILGKKLLKEGRYPSIVPPLVGTVAYFLLQSLLIQIGFNLKYFNAFQAGIVFLTLRAFQKATQHNRPQIIDHLGV